jgi:hypothetical protein
MDFDLSFDVAFEEFPVRAPTSQNIIKTFKFVTFTADVHASTLQKNTFVHDLPHLFRYNC